MKQGDICIVKLEPVVGHEQSKTRPCVIIQCNMLNTYLSTIIIAPITSTIPNKKYPNIVALSKELTNLKKDGVIKIEQLRCIDKSRIQKVIGSIPPQKIDEIKHALRAIFTIY
ncbi:MAG: type II toxin-antitoxin system PemK/MazF family toxin [Candidatus Woesearchaeota archaeon]